MLIRHRLIFQFSSLVAAILILFSIAVYSFYAFGKKDLFRSRLKNKAISTAIIFSEIKIDRLDEVALKSLTNQYEVIYDETCKELYSTGNANNFVPSKKLFASIKQEKEVYFSYKDNIEGIGVYYSTPLGKKIFVLVTGIDAFGIEFLNSLRDTLIIGTIAGLLLAFVASLFFSKNALKPINDFIKHVRQLTGNQMKERLLEGDIQDEITNLAMEFNKLLDRLETIVESHKSFISNTSHELRTPLAAILGTLETSYAYDKDIESTKKSIHSSIGELKEMIELTNGLLNLVKVEGKGKELIYETVDLLDIVLDSIKMNNKKYLSQHIEFNVHKIGEDSFGYFIKGNKHLLIIAISNIIDNACKYSDGKNVSVSLNIENQTIQLLVQDGGVGISKENQKNIFDPLFRGDNIKNITGFGIGLTLVYKIIHLHEGSIVISSALNKGTAVEITFNLNSV
jgi:signal transduction histidine kinase